jgi:ABC-type transport system involved in multi-copper enzyme maturation permease subunit
MRDWLGLLAAELLKIVRRRLTWVLLLALIAGFALHASSLNADRVSYGRAESSGEGRYGQPLSPSAAKSGEVATIARMTLPGFLNEVWVITDVWGVFALLILGAVQAGEEYDGGTIRTVLTRGPSRAGWLLAKLAALFLIAGIAWAVLAAEGGLLGLWTHLEATGGLDLSAIRHADLTAFLGRLLRAWLAVLPYLSLVLAIAVVGRGTGPSLLVGLVGRFIEQGSGFFGAVLIGMQMAGNERLNIWFRLWAPLQTASFEWNAQVLRTWGDPLGWNDILTAMGSPGAMQHLPSPLHSSPWLGAAVLLGWTLAWLGLAALSLARTDVTA